MDSHEVKLIERDTGKRLGAVYVKDSSKSKHFDNSVHSAHSALIILIIAIGIYLIYACIFSDYPFERRLFSSASSIDTFNLFKMNYNLNYEKSIISGYPINVPCKNNNLPPPVKPDALSDLLTFYKSVKTPYYNTGAYIGVSTYEGNLYGIENVSSTTGYYTVIGSSDYIDVFNISEDGLVIGGIIKNVDETTNLRLHYKKDGTLDCIIPDVPIDCTCISIIKSDLTYIYYLVIAGKTNFIDFYRITFNTTSTIGYEKISSTYFPPLVGVGNINYIEIGNCTASSFDGIPHSCIFSTTLGYVYLLNFTPVSNTSITNLILHGPIVASLNSTISISKLSKVAIIDSIIYFTIDSGMNNYETLPGITDESLITAVSMDSQVTKCLVSLTDNTIIIYTVDVSTKAITIDITKQILGLDGQIISGSVNETGQTIFVTNHIGLEYMIDDTIYNKDNGHVVPNISASIGFALLCKNNGVRDKIVWSETINYYGKTERSLIYLNILLPYLSELSTDLPTDESILQYRLEYYVAEPGIAEQPKYPIRQIGYSDIDINWFKVSFGENINLIVDVTENLLTRYIINND